MATRTLAVTTLVEASPDLVFAWVADYHHAARALDAVRRWEPVDRERTSGVGARFAVRIVLLGLEAGATLVLDDWEVPRRIGWHASDGPLPVRGMWTFSDHPSGTEVRLAIAYDPPGGALGGWGARGLEGSARRRLAAGLEVLRAAVETS